MKNAGIQFLLKAYPNNISHSDFRYRQERRKLSGEKSPSGRAEEVEDYLNILQRTHNSHNEKPWVVKNVRRYYHEVHVIKELPSSYIETQRRLAAEQGHGNLEITNELKGRLKETVTSDQKASLNLWLDYLTSPDTSHYPMWVKYWVFNSMVKLSAFDIEKQIFGDRSKNTVTPFPELNREALACVIDTVIKLVEENDLSKDVRLISFKKLYANEISKITVIKESDLENTKGEWIKYPQGSDHMKLVKALQGKNTGWCTAAESTAQTHLQGGDFYVYYSYNSSGEPAFPRAAIRMENEDLVEVRGIGIGQNLDPYISDVVNEKLKEFPDGERYKKKSADMKRLTQLVEKTKEGNDLNIEELKFLYEIDSKIKGFGYEKDPRIEEIIEKRDKKEDLAKILKCPKEQIAINEEEINDNTIVAYNTILALNYPLKSLPEGLTHISGDLILIQSRLTSLPKGLTYVGGDLTLMSSQITSLPEGLIHIGGDFELCHSQITSLPGGLTYIGGNFDLRHKSNKITSLPEGLTYVGGNLDLRTSQITSLPEGLTYVGGNLDLGNITSLPERLTHVGGNLYLSKSLITSLPKNINQIVRGKVIYI
jgi:hypothetical protein